MNNNDFTLLLGTQLDTTGAQKGLQEFKKKVDSVSFEDIGDGYKIFKTLTTYINSAGQSFKKFTETLSDGKGEFVELNSEVVKLGTNYSKLGTHIKQTIKSQNELGHSITTVVDTAKGLKTVVTEFTTQQGTAVKKTEQFTLANNELVSSLTETVKNENYASEKAKELALARQQEAEELYALINAEEKDTQTKIKEESATKNLTNSNKKLGQSFVDVIGKVAKFYLATLPIQAIQKTITNAVEVVKEFDSAITEMGKVSEYSRQRLSNYTKQVGELGKEVGRTRTEMTDMTTGWLKAGYSEEESAQLAKFSALLQNTADEELSASEATSILVSQLKAYNIGAEDAIVVTDVMNKVSAEFAVSSGDIAKGLTQASASMATYGNDIYQTTALLTAGTTIFQGKSQQVARGLNQVANRVAKNEKALQEYGVSVKDANGELRSTYDILVDLKPKWDKMTSSQKVALGTTLAGTNQYKIFSAVMNQMGTAVEAYNEALNSNGETLKQNEVYMGSLEAKVAGLKSEFEDFVLGDGGLQDFAKAMVSSTTNILKFINTIGGLKTIFVALAGVIATVKFDTVAKTFTTLINIVPMLTSKLHDLKVAFSVGRKGVMSYDVALKAMGISATTAQLALGALTAIVTGAIMAYSAYQNAQQQAYEQRQENITTTLSEVESLEQLKSQIEDENITREELNDAVKNNLSQYDDEISKIEDLNTARQTAIDRIKEEIDARNQKIIDTGYKDYTDALKAQNKSYSIAFPDYENEFGQFFDRLGDVQGNRREYKSNNLESYINSLSKAIEYIQGLDNGSEKYSYTLSKLSTELAKAQENSDKYSGTIDTFNQALAQQGKRYDETRKRIVDLTPSEKEFIKSQQDASRSAQEQATHIQELRDSYSITDDEIQKYIETHQDAIDGLEDGQSAYDYAVEQLANERAEAEGVSVALAELKNKYDEVTKGTTAIASSYSTLNSALSEISEQGSLTLATQMSLIDAGYASALVYDEETKSVTLDKDALVALTQAKIQEQIANLELEKSNIIQQMKDEGIVALDTASKFLQLAKAKSMALGAESEGFNGMPTSVQDMFSETEDYCELLEDIDAQIEALKSDSEKLGEDGADAFSKMVSGAKKSSKATDSTTDAVKKLTEALEKAKQKALDAVDKQISALKKEKETAVKAIEKEIKALEREREAREKYWKEQLDALEKENTERERNIALQEKQEALARAQQTRVMVLKDGQFQYSQDEYAVADAQQSLTETEDKNEYEKQKELIEELRDTELEWYDERIQALEDYKEQVEEYYDEQIEMLEEYKDYLEEYYDQQIEMLENEKEAISQAMQASADDQESKFQLMLEQLRKFIAEWNELAGQMEGIGGFDFSVLLGASGKSTGDNSVGAYSSGSNSIKAYSKGKGTIGDSELAVVGENPKYKEIVIGSQLNNDQGVIMNLKRGSGVVNAQATNTLAGLFHSLSGANSNASASNITNNSGSTINIGSITLPQVENGSDFIDYLQNFNIDLTQNSYS